MWTEERLKTINSLYGHLTVIESLERYINHGIAPGGFLTAVLENNLERAVSRADLYNQKTLVDIVRLIYNHAPRGCWGYEGVVAEWKERITNVAV